MQQKQYQCNMEEAYTRFMSGTKTRVLAEEFGISQSHMYNKIKKYAMDNQLDWGKEFRNVMTLEQVAILEKYGSNRIPITLKGLSKLSGVSESRIRTFFALSGYRFGIHITYNDVLDAIDRGDSVYDLAIKFDYPLSSARDRVFKLGFTIADIDMSYSSEKLIHKNMEALGETI